MKTIWYDTILKQWYLYYGTELVACAKYMSDFDGVDYSFGIMTIR